MISIADDGLGISEELDINNLPESGHFGLLGISERVALLGGRYPGDKPAGKRIGTSRRNSTPKSTG